MKYSRFKLSRSSTSRLFTVVSTLAEMIGRTPHAVRGSRGTGGTDGGTAWVLGAGWTYGNVPCVAWVVRSLPTAVILRFRKTLHLLKNDSMTMNHDSSN